MKLTGVSQVIGLVGDGATFCGAYLIARGEAGEAERVEQVEGILKTYQEIPGFKGLPIRIGARVVQGPKDVAVTVSRVFSDRARLGSWILMIGFGLLLISRILDIFGVEK